MPQPTMPLNMRQGVARSGLEEELVAKVKTANDLQSTTTVVEIASIINNRCIQSSSSNHSIIHNRRPHGSSSGGDIRSQMQRQHPQHEQLGSWARIRPPPQKKYRSGA